MVSWEQVILCIPVHQHTSAMKRGHQLALADNIPVESKLMDHFGAGEMRSMVRSETAVVAV
jgi:hypothetical protein